MLQDQLDKFMEQKINGLSLEEARKLVSGLLAILTYNPKFDAYLIKVRSRLDIIKGALDWTDKLMDELVELEDKIIEAAENN